MHERIRLADGRIVRFVRSFDKDDLGLAASHCTHKMPRDGVRMVPHREPIKRIGEHRIDLPGDGSRIETSDR